MNTYRLQGTKANSASPLGSPSSGGMVGAQDEVLGQRRSLECSSKQTVPETWQRPAILSRDPAEASGHSVEGHEFPLPSGSSICSPASHETFGNQEKETLQHREEDLTALATAQETQTKEVSRGERSCLKGIGVPCRQEEELGPKGWKAPSMRLSVRTQCKFPRFSEAGEENKNEFKH